MVDNDSLAEQFEEKRGHLRGVAYRMLGSLAEADDAVQEAWLRLSRSGGSRQTRMDDSPGDPQRPTLTLESGRVLRAERPAHSAIHRGVPRRRLSNGRLATRADS